ncbi:MAG: hypothetical protein MUC83_17670 [Pirellula sp.]|nr:hypothetical protein [Pirellula sp.]
MSQPSGDTFAELTSAISQEDAGAVQSWFLSRDFYLLVLASEEDEEAYSALIVEGEDFPAVVVFLDEERANTFSKTIAEQLDGEVVELLEVDGATLLDPLNFEIGIVLNPEEEDMILVHPDLVGMDIDGDDEDEDEEDYDDEEDDDFDDEEEPDDKEKK